MKRNLLLPVFCLLASLAWGQLFVISPESASVDYTESDFDVHADATLTYNGTTPITVRWEIIDLDINKAQNFYACLLEFCFPPGVTSGTYNIDPGSSFPVQGHLLPLGVCEDGSFKIAFSNNTTGEHYVTGTFNFVCRTTSTSNPFGGIKAGALYPNPAVNWFAMGDVPGADRIEIYNIIGKQVAQFAYQPSGRYDIHQLPGGLYLVRVIDRRGNQLHTKRLTKNTP
jgi:hypothetical protein